MNITPAVEMEMAGFSERDHGAEGIHDDLFAKCLVLEKEDKRIAYVSIDAIGVDQAFVHQVRIEVAMHSEIEAERVMVQATHTHSGPAAIRIHQRVNLVKTGKITSADEAYYELTLKKVVGVILWANRTLEEVKIGYDSRTIDTIGSNRNNRDEVYDNSVNVLKIENADAEVVGIVCNYACHPTVLGQHNYQFSSDYPSYFRQYLEAAYPHATVIFSQGCAGNISTRFTKKESSFEEANRFGELLGQRVKEMLPRIVTADVNQLDAKCLKVSLDVKHYPTDEQLQASIEKYTGLLQQLEQENADSSVIRKNYVTLQGLTRSLNAKHRITFKEVTTEIQVLDLGLCRMVSVPGDVFNEIGLAIKQFSDSVIICGYANDSVGYVVSSEGYQQDSYEINMTYLDEYSGDRLITTAKTLLDSLK